MIPRFDSQGRYLGSVEYDPACGHKNAECIGTCAEGCCDRYLCKDCGKRFLVECPD